jgi:ribose 5-phosphate isomerase B
MKIAIGCDHRGFKLKEFLKEKLREDFEVLDFGTFSEESTHYPIYAKKVLICATGIGMSIAANKIRGVRAAHVCSDELVELSRRHNNANIICFGSIYTDEETALRWVKNFTSTPFEGGRHSIRVDMIEDVSDR